MAIEIKPAFRAKGSQLPMLFAVILLIWVGYTVLFALYVPEPVSLILGFIPGLLGLILLRLSGFTVGEIYLKPAPVSRAGLVVLAGTTVLMLPVIVAGLEAGGWAGWSWVAVFLYAPMSGIAQELFFRSGMTPAFLKMFGRKTTLALVLQAALFAIFHIGMLRVAPPWAVFSALMVTFLAGMGWGWQVQRDRTVLWAGLHHALLQVLLRMFQWG